MQKAGLKRDWERLMLALQSETLIRKILRLEKELNSRLESMAPAELAASLSTCLCCLAEVGGGRALRSGAPRCGPKAKASCHATKLYRYNSGPFIQEAMAPSRNLGIQLPHT